MTLHYDPVTKSFLPSDPTPPIDRLIMRVVEDLQPAPPAPRVEGPRPVYVSDPSLPPGRY